MIQYEDISTEDMRNYWGMGCVLVPHKSANGVCYNAYQANIDKNRISLDIVGKLGRHGNPPEQVVWTYDEFFRNAMLHRPHLGVLVDGEVVYNLGWQHANGMQQGKALDYKDIHVTTIRQAPKAKKPTVPNGEWSLYLAELYVARQEELEEEGLFGNMENRRVRERLRTFDLQYLDRLQRHPHVRKPPEEPRERGEGIHDNAMALILKCLNQRPQSIREIMDSPNGLYYIQDTMWAEKSDQGIFLFNGNIRMGTVGPLMNFHTNAPTQSLAVAHKRLAYNLLAQEKLHVR